MARDIAKADRSGPRFPLVNESLPRSGALPRHSVAEDYCRLCSKHVQLRQNPARLSRGNCSSRSMVLEGLSSSPRASLDDPQPVGTVH